MYVFRCARCGHREDRPTLGKLRTTQREHRWFAHGEGEPIQAPTPKARSKQGAKGNVSQAPRRSARMIVRAPRRRYGHPMRDRRAAQEMAALTAELRR